ncbi:hypothetical protein [Dactylosporangium sp. CA-233914]|uniref:hypothetical protein n=1 Tax=Dactylosporangium sp. CA-233914 TaxID=3239934 RepID=UPI003D905054
MEVEAPVAQTAARLDALDPYAGFAVIPDDDGWVPLAGAEAGGHVNAWLTQLDTVHGRRSVAGSMLGMQFGEAVAGVAVAAMVLDGRCPDPAVGNLAVRVHAEGYLERRAVLTPAVAVLPSDPAAADPHSVVVADEAALDEWWAQRAATTLTPLLAAIRARVPFSLRNLWGGVADEVAGTAIWVAQLAGRDAEAAWQHGRRLVDALARHAPVRLAAGRPFPVAYPGGRRLFQVRGTCCLYYRSAAETGPPQETYCTTCPLRDDDSRRQRLHDHLTETSAESVG